MGDHSFFYFPRSFAIFVEKLKLWQLNTPA